MDVALADFDLIDPCGMPGLTSTSIAAELGHRGEPPSTARVAGAAAVFARALTRHLASAILGVLPPDADPAAERRALDELLAVPVP